MSNTLENRQDAQAGAMRALVRGLTEFPELRIGQLIWNAVEANEGPDVFNIENDALESALKSFQRKWSNE